jgi:hypothetical protein
MTRKLTLLICTAILLLSACNMPNASQGVSSGGPQAWIDAPLDGMRLPLQPYLLTLHGSDPHGISILEVSVDGVVLASITNPDPATLLVYATQNWTPHAPGRYQIRLRARNTAGAWSAEDLVTVIIEDNSTPTPPPTDTPTVTVTMTATPPATRTQTPTLVPQNGFAGPPVFNPTQLNLPYDCPSTKLTAEIKVGSTSGIRVLMLFYRLEDKAFSEQSDWDNVGMSLVGANTYQKTFDPVKGGTLFSWLTSRWTTTWEGWVSIQFAIQDTNGGVTRSEVYRLVKIAGCH